MIIEDFVMLGRTVPESSKSHGTAVCSAGFSIEMRSFIRVYPLRIEDRIPVGSIVNIPVTRSPDSRPESWKLKEVGGFSIVGDLSHSDRFDYIDKPFGAESSSKSTMITDSIATLNHHKLSLGSIKPVKIKGFSFSELSQDEERQFPLFDEERSFGKMVPRITFCDDAGDHKLQLRDWGAYEYLRRFPDNPEGLWDNLKFTDPDYDHIFFVGNHKLHRSSWLIISCLHKLRNRNIDLFD